jgi:serine/threonine protein kinase
MKNSDGLSDSVPGVNKSPGKCEKCGATIQFHTGVCASCLLGEGLEAGDEVSRAVFESVIAEVDVPDKQWRLGDYEILDEIGRGGMGVIYLARQRHPQRIVAVKRVLNYHADSHETLKRFRREADAAASLDHPNILPIYEVSESADGLPFFSMKFATGGSLQKVASALRAEPRRCVQLMAKVARAVEYAHGQGILHRDLKPGNILLDGRGEPLVSDFGLAKWLDANKDITKSLTAFGTPGYTAPEQAEGDTAGLTPARGCLQSRRDSLRAARRPPTVCGRQRACRHSAGCGNTRTETALALTLTRPGFRNHLRALSRARSKSALPNCRRSRD